jgi:hypothetical protein
MVIDGTYNYGENLTLYKTISCRTGNITGWFKNAPPLIGIEPSNSLTVVNNGSTIYSNSIASNGSWEYFSIGVTSGTCTISFNVQDFNDHESGYVSIDDISIPIP